MRLRTTSASSSLARGYAVSETLALLRAALDIVVEGKPRRMPRDRDPTPILKAAAQCHRKERRWLRTAAVQGVGIANRTTRGSRSGDLTLKVYVDEKKPKSKVRHLVPPRLRIPDLGVVETDVEEIGKIRPNQVFRARVRPAMPGSSVGHPGGNAGTLGCLVQRIGDSGGIYILSNAHVLTRIGNQRIGDDTIQPGREDLSLGGSANPVIAKVAGFRLITFNGSGFPNTVDAAISRANRASDLNQRFRSYSTQPTGVKLGVARGWRVRKIGRVSDEQSEGVVQDTDFFVRVPYVVNGNVKKAGFRDQVLCSRFTSSGDSGAIVTTVRGNKIVGLHFAGSSTTSIFNKIGNVLSDLQVQVLL